jgi:hypothetical protein
MMAIMLSERVRTKRKRVPAGREVRCGDTLS